MKESPRPGCLTPDQLTELFDGRLPAADSERLRAHIEECVPCKTEWKMLAEFTAAEPTPEEREDVRKLVRDLKRSRRPVSESGRRWREWFRLPAVPAFAGALAALALVVAVGIQWRSTRGTDLGGFQSTGEVRSGITLQVSPRGDLHLVPAEFTWDTVPGADRYEVLVTEVDGTEIWRERTSEPRVGVPDRIRRAIVPLKTLVCQVTALDRSGGRLAQSEAVRFRLMPANGR